MIALLRKSNYSKALLLLVALACLLVAGTRAALAQDAPMQSPVAQPNPSRPVVDTANVIDDATEERLNNLLIELDKQAKIEFGVVTVKTTGDQDIFNYSLAVMRGWGIGTAEKGGLLLLVAVDDRKYYTQVSRHLEGDLPDGVVGQIQREKLVPQFKQGNYSQGIADTVDAYVATLAEKRGFTLTNVDRRKAYQPPQRTRAPQFNLSSKCCGLLIILGIVIFFLVKGGGRGGRGGGGSGLLSALLWGSVLSNLGSRSSGWSGGGFGGSGGSSWGGGGGSDWGGFSGGGGDAGGGGAGGGW